jgi:hypothetical protein
MAAATALGDRMNWRSGACLAMLPLASAAAAEEYWVTAAGLGGEAEYEQRFSAEAGELDKLLKGRGVHVVTLAGPGATKAELNRALSDVARSARPEDDFVLVLIGHGSFDGVGYKFNLRGPDVTASELASWCNAVPARRQLIVDTSSASGAAIPALRREGRAVIAATKSGTEKNATVFARFWLEALQDPATDIDKSDSVSAMEAFQYAQRKTAEFYAAQKRLATEHPVFEDTGKGAAVREPSRQSGEGQLLASLTLLRLGSQQDEARDNTDPARKDLLTRRDKLQRQIDLLKYQKAAMDEQSYQSQLKSLLLELARTQARLDR